MRESNNKSSLPPITIFPKTPKVENIESMGSIEINNKFDEFKIRLEIFKLKQTRLNNFDKSELNNIENEFSEFLNKINSPTIINNNNKGETNHE